MSQGPGSGSHRASGRWVSPTIIRLISALAALFLVATPLLTAQSAAAAPAAAPASDLRTTLNLLGEEHVYLAGYAFNAAIAGRSDEFKIAAAAVDQNTQELGKAIGSVYGSQAEQTFLVLWRAHIGMFVEYTQGAAAKDNAKKQKAMNDLQGYRQDIGAFLASANPNLPKEAVADLFGPHVTHLTGTIDALAAKDAPKAYMMLHDAAHQTMDIMDPLAGAIVKQFSDEFPAGMTQQAAPAAAPKPVGNPPAAAAPAPAAAAKPAAGAPAAAQSPAQMPAALPRTGEAPSPFLPADIAALIGLMLVGGGLAVSRARR